MGVVGIVNVVAVIKYHPLLVKTNKLGGMFTTTNYVILRHMVGQLF